MKESTTQHIDNIESAIRTLYSFAHISNNCVPVFTDGANDVIDEVLMDAIDSLEVLQTEIYEVANHIPEDIEFESPFEAELYDQLRDLRAQLEDLKKQNKALGSDATLAETINAHHIYQSNIELKKQVKDLQCSLAESERCREAWKQKHEYAIENMQKIETAHEAEMMNTETLAEELEGLKAQADDCVDRVLKYESDQEQIDDLRSRNLSLARQVDLLKGKLKQDASDRIKQYETYEDKIEEAEDLRDKALQDLEKAEEELGKLRDQVEAYRSTVEQYSEPYEEQIKELKKRLKKMTDSNEKNIALIKDLSATNTQLDKLAKARSTQINDLTHRRLQQQAEIERLTNELDDQTRKARNGFSAQQNAQEKQRMAELSAKQSESLAAKLREKLDAAQNHNAKLDASIGKLTNFKKAKKNAIDFVSSARMVKNKSELVDVVYDGIINHIKKS